MTELEKLRVEVEQLTEAHKDMLEKVASDELAVLSHKKEQILKLAEAAEKPVEEVNKSKIDDLFKLI